MTKANDVDQRELERETVRLTERYVSEVVSALDLCPWAARALATSTVQISVITDIFGASQLSMAARRCGEQLAVTTSDIELVLLVLPRLSVRRLDMDTLLGLLRDDLAAREGVASFAVAAFHPEADPDTTTGERFIPFLRRSPDPLVQAVRFASLERIEHHHSGGTTFLDPTALDPASWSTASTETLRSRIARRNLEHVLEQGLETVRARLDDICDDRRRTHLRLGIVD